MINNNKIKEELIYVLWSRRIRSGSIFSISLILRSIYKKKFIFSEKIELKILKKYKNFLFIDQFTDDIFRNNKILNTVKILKENKCIVNYMDCSDSPEIKYPEYVNSFKSWFKKQIYRDLRNYNNNLIGGRLYSNYYASKFFCITEKNNEYININFDKSKLKIYWNILLGPYPLNSTKMRIIRYAVKFFGISYLKIFNYSIIKNKIKTNKLKVNLLHTRIGDYKNYTQSVGYQRKLITNILKDKLNIKVEKISQKLYNKEMESSFCTLSPFGWGEICHRDAESFMNGSLLLKPNMDHIITSPDLYTRNISYLDFDWSCEDLHEKILDVEENRDKYIKIANYGMHKFYEENKNFNNYVNDLYNNIIN